MGDFISFRRMITPVIIKVIFWLGVAGAIIAGIYMMVTSGYSDRWGGGINGFQILMGLVTIIVGPIMVRVYCEILILFFVINDSLTDIRRKLVSGGGSTSPILSQPAVSGWSSGPVQPPAGTGAATTFCSNCGAAIPSDSAFCVKCGARAERA